MEAFLWKVNRHQNNFHQTGLCVNTPKINYSEPASQNLNQHRLLSGVELNYLPVSPMLASEACESHIQIRTGSESRKMLELHKTSRRPECISAGWTLGIIVHFSFHFYSFLVWIASMVVVLFSTLLPHHCVFWYATGWKQAHGLAWNITLWTVSVGKGTGPLKQGTNLECSGACELSVAFVLKTVYRAIEKGLSQHG